MKTKHTKGLWRVVQSESKNAWNVVGTLLGGKYKIARVPYILLERKDDNDKFNRAARREAEADAKLIAAAPELLEALKTIQANPNDPYSHRIAMDAINKAIN